MLKQAVHILVVGTAFQTGVRQLSTNVLCFPVAGYLRLAGHVLKIRM
jgi:hypothetical protein